MNKLLVSLLAGIALCASGACADDRASPVQSPDSAATLEDTFWKVMSIGGREVVVVGNQREPHMVFHSKDKRLAAFAGCNQMSGTYSIEGDKLKLSRLSATMMACEHGMEEEQALHNALNEVSGWAIRGETLELYDAQGKSLATFEGGD